MKNVLHLIETSGPGGAERTLISLAQNLGKNSYTSLVCLLKEGWLKSQLERLGVETIMVPQHRSVDALWLFRVQQLLRRRSVHVMHAHEFGMNVYGSVLSRVTGVPIVATVHGKDYFWVKRRRRVAYRFVARQSTMVSVSEDLKRFITQRLGIGPEKVKVVHNGIDLERYAEVGRCDAIRKELELNEDRPVIGTVGNLYVVKGQTYLLKACARIARVFPNFVLLVTGRGERLGVLEKEVRDLGIWDNVKFLGFREDVPSLLHALDVFVLPSLSEGLPLSVLEAMACAKPIVASNVGGVPEVIRDGVTGYLVPPKDPAALADRILRLLRDPELAMDFGRSGRKIVEEGFSIERMVKDYQVLYEGGGGDP